MCTTESVGFCGADDGEDLTGLRILKGLGSGESGGKCIDEIGRPGGGDGGGVDIFLLEHCAGGGVGPFVLMRGRGGGGVDPFELGRSEANGFDIDRNNVDGLFWSHKAFSWSVIL